MISFYCFLIEASASETQKDIFFRIPCTKILCFGTEKFQLWFRPSKPDMTELKNQYHLGNASLGERSYTFKQYFKSLLAFYQKQNQGINEKNLFSVPKSQNLYVQKMNLLKAHKLI